MSRLEGWHNKVSWLVRFAIPQMSVAIYCGIELPISVLVFLVLWQILMGIYEVGYLMNDFKTIRLESNPTLRMNPHFRTWVEENFGFCCASKLAISACFCLLSPIVIGMIQVETYPWQFSVAAAVAALGFIGHNSWRGRVNVVTYFLLATAKFLAIPLMFINLEVDWEVALFLWILFPVPRTIEHAAKPKYQLLLPQKLTSQVDLFRVIYLGILLGVVSILWIIDPTQSSGFLCVLSGYMFSVRLAALLARARFGLSGV